MKICSVEGCKQKVKTGGLCNKHYIRLRKRGTTDSGPRAWLPLNARFWKKVRRGDGCWEWLGGKTAQGYGTIHKGGSTRHTVLAHRLSYELNCEPIPQGMVVMHSCDNPSCVNPDHLSLGTPQDNTQDMIRKGRLVRERNTENFCRGERHGSSKVTDDLVRQIRISDRATKEWAAELGMSTVAVNNIRRRKTWKHVE